MTTAWPAPAAEAAETDGEERVHYTTSTCALHPCTYSTDQSTKTVINNRENNNITGNSNTAARQELKCL